MATLPEALADCLEALRSGGDVEDCLRRHGRYRKQIEALLDVARRIPPFPPEAFIDCRTAERLRRRAVQIARDLDAGVGPEAVTQPQRRRHGRHQRRSA